MSRNWARVYLVQAAVGLVLGLLVAVVSRPALLTAAAALGVELGAGDLMVMVIQDVYLLCYCLWPILVISLARQASLHAEPTYLLRRGSLPAFTVAGAVSALGCGLATAIGLGLGAAAGAIGLPLTGSLADFGPGDFALGLSTLAVNGFGVLQAWLLQAGYLCLATGVIGAGFSLMSVMARRALIPLSLLVALFLPVVFKAWPLAVAANPINGLLLYHAVVSGLPVWLPMVINVALIAIVAAIPLVARRTIVVA